MEPLAFMLSWCPMLAVAPPRPCAGCFVFCCSCTHPRGLVCLAGTVYLTQPPNLTVCLPWTPELSLVPVPRGPQSVPVLGPSPAWPCADTALTCKHSCHMNASPKVLKKSKTINKPLILPVPKRDNYLGTRFLTTYLLTLLPTIFFICHECHFPGSLSLPLPKT